MTWRQLLEVVHHHSCYIAYVRRYPMHLSLCFPLMRGCWSGRRSTFFVTVYYANVVLRRVCHLTQRVYSDEKG